MNLGDIALGSTHDFKFATSVGGVMTTLAGSPVVAAYIGNDTTEITAGITLSVDFDGRTGLNNVRLVATSGNGYTTATDVRLVLTAGTLGGVSVVGRVVGECTIEYSSVYPFLDTEIAAILAAVDTEVAAIKAKTDSLTFTVANVVDANTRRVHDVALVGDGAATPWGS